MLSNLPPQIGSDCKIFADFGFADFGFADFGLVGFGLADFGQRLVPKIPANSPRSQTHTTHGPSGRSPSPL
jgi:hypothetical protein